MEFFNGTTKLGEDLTTPYTFIWNNVPEGSYSLNAVATDNENGVTTSESIAISVTNAVGNPAAGGVEDLYSGIPRFFSPNDDGTGDYWEWTQPELFANSLLTVFNRSGQKVFEALSYNNTWDGKQDGQPLQAGDYYYVIKMPDLTELRGVCSNSSVIRNSAFLKPDTRKFLLRRTIDASMVFLYFAH